MINTSLNKIQKSKFQLSIPTLTSESTTLGIMLALVGGFLDAYTFVGRNGVFANAQTGNIVLVGINALERNWGQMFDHILPILAFITGVMVTEAIKKHLSIAFLSKWEHKVLIFEMIIFVFVAFAPKSVPNGIINIIVSFATSLQYCAFKNLSGYPYATTMCTGNLRSASQAAYAAFSKKDREAAKKSIKYFTVIFSFLIGTGIGGLLTFSIGNESVLAVDILLVICLTLLELNEAKVKKDYAEVN